MKKYIIFAFIGAMLAFVACEPIEDRDELEPALTEAEIEYTITVEGNYVHVENNTQGAIARWVTSSGKISNKNDDRIYIPQKGDYSIEITLLKGDKIITVADNFTINETDAAYYAHEAWSYLSADKTSRTWVWAVDNNLSDNQWIWGNGGTGDNHPAWWGRTALDYDQENPSIDIDGEMTFAFDGTDVSFTITENGSTTNGVFDLDMGTNDLDNSIGTIYFTGATILHGISQNDGKKVVYDFDICSITDDELVLGRRTESADWEAWYWVFKRKGYTYPAP